MTTPVEWSVNNSIKSIKSWQLYVRMLYLIVVVDIIYLLINILCQKVPDEQDKNKMNATNYYVSTARVVLQGDPDTAQTWQVEIFYS